MTQPINLSLLPKPDVVEQLDYETILSQVKEGFIAVCEKKGRTDLIDGLAYESEPTVVHLESMAYREMILRQRVNDAALARMLAYAKKADLDAEGARYGVFRLVLSEGDPTATPPIPKVMESDEAFLLRIVASMEGQSNAGTDGSWDFQTRVASPLVKDVDVQSPNPCEVLITILSGEPAGGEGIGYSSGDGTPSASLLDTVRTHLSQKDVRQLGAPVTVNGAAIIAYSVQATLKIPSVTGAAEAVAAARKAMQAEADKRHALGSRVPISAIHAALSQPGVLEVVLSSPATDVVPTATQAPYCTAIQLATEVVEQ